MILLSLLFSPLVAIQCSPLLHRIHEYYHISSLPAFIYLLVLFYRENNLLVQRNSSIYYLKICCMLVCVCVYRWRDINQYFYCCILLEFSSIIIKPHKNNEKCVHC